MLDLIKNFMINLKDLLTDFFERPMYYGIKISYFLISLGASLWLIAFTLGFVTKMLGL